MSETGDSPSKYNRGGPKSSKTNQKRRNKRANSMDSCRSVSTIASSAESTLLRSDGEETLQSTANGVAKLGKAKNFTAKPKQQANQDDPVIKLLMDLKKNQFTKQDSQSLQKSFEDKFAAVGSELKAHNSRFVDIEERLSQFERGMASASYERELQKQQQLKQNISIFGCPKLDGENVKSTALQVFKAFGCDFNVNDFAAVYRTDGKSPKFSSIIVKFNDFNKKLTALNSKAKKPVKVSDVVGATANQTNVQIYLNNHVTPFFGRLLAAGRQATKDEIIHSCWIGATGCLIKMKEDSKPTNIRSMDDFDMLRARAGSTEKKKRNKPDDPSSPTDSNPKKK